MKFSLQTLALLATTVSAVNYHGRHYTSEQIKEVEDFANYIHGSTNATLRAVLTTNDLDSDEAMSFMKDNYVSNTTLREYIAMDKDIERHAVDKRAPTYYQCRNSGPALGDFQISRACAQLSALAGTSAATVAWILDNLTCNRAGITACHAFFIITGAQVGNAGINEVGNFCPDLLRGIKNECGDYGGTASSDDAELTATVRIESGSQGDCRDIVGNCQVGNN